MINELEITPQQLLKLNHKKEELRMEEFLLKASNAGDIEATFELGKLYLEGDKIKEGAELIEQAAEKNYTAAIMELANLKQGAGDYETALELFKKASRAGNISAMQNAVNICEEKKDFAALKEIAEIIQSRYNDIYNNTDFLRRMWYFGSSGTTEYLPEYARAIERRKIFNRIQKILNK